MIAIFIICIIETSYAMLIFNAMLIGRIIVCNLGDISI